MTQLRFYFQTSQLPPPESLNWLRFAGFDVQVKSIEEAPEGWCKRYRCCLPLVVWQGRIYLKGGFTPQQVQRLALQFLGRPKLGWLAPVASCFSAWIPETMARGAVNTDWQEVLRRMLAKIPNLVPESQKPDVLRRLEIVPLDRPAQSDPEPLSQFCRESFHAGYRPVILSVSRRLCPDWTALANLIESLKSHDAAFVRNARGVVSTIGLRSWRSNVVGSFDRDGEGFSDFDQEAIAAQGVTVAEIQESTDRSHEARFLSQLLEEQLQLTTEPSLRFLIERARGEFCVGVLGGMKENQ